LSRASPATPRRGEIWLVNFNPTVGAEIQKTRPAVVVSSDAVGRLPIKLIAPLTDWKEYFAPNMWHVRIVPSATNGLTKESAVDTLQLRGRNGAKWCQACLFDVMGPASLQHLGLWERSLPRLKEILR
jgi:mRNA interferase MazF